MALVYMIATGTGSGTGSGDGSGGCGGYGDGSGDGSGSGDSYRSGYGCGDGYGYGYGNGNGYGCGDSSSEGCGSAFGECDVSTIGSVGSEDVLASPTPWGTWVRIGCQSFMLAHWRKKWRAIARANNVHVTATKAAELIAKAEALEASS